MGSLNQESASMDDQFEDFEHGKPERLVLWVFGLCGAAYFLFLIVGAIWLADYLITKYLGA